MVSPAGHNFDTPRESPQANLQYIRRTLDAAGRLSNVSGAGIIAVGVLALAAVVLNLYVTGTPWSAAGHWFSGILVWALLLAVSASVAAASMAAKAQRSGQVFWSPVLRKAIWICSAPMFLGAILSAAMLRASTLGFLPMIWLGCYGAALSGAGVMSVSPVRWMGISFLALATVAVFVPVTFGLALLAGGFGFLHLLFGAYIYWRHDG